MRIHPGRLSHDELSHGVNRTFLDELRGDHRHPEIRPLRSFIAVVDQRIQATLNWRRGQSGALPESAQLHANQGVKFRPLFVISPPNFSVNPLILESEFSSSSAPGPARNALRELMRRNQV
jgi:hypothetical protein